MSSVRVVWGNPAQGLDCMRGTFVRAFLCSNSFHPAADWQHKYGHPVYLLESFVEPPRFAGACYRAAGWVQVGLTTGRTRNDDGRKPRVACKALFLKPLRADAQRRLAA